MRAMVLEAANQPLRLVERETPTPGPDEVLLEVHACGVCRTDLHIADGELQQPRLPLVLGHEIVGTVVEAGESARWQPGTRLGIPWLGRTCGRCRYCAAGRENLCEAACFTGYQRDGGYADHVVADARFCLPIPDGLSARDAAPLLCAGLIGYRSLGMTGEARRLGLYGFGAAAHIVLQVARYQGREVYAFVRPGDSAGERFARDLGAVWAGPSDVCPPVELDAAIIFAPAGELIPRALRAVCRGGTVVCGGIHMSAIPSFSYDLLWGERVLRSVANLTRADGVAFMELAPRVPVHCEVQPYALTDAGRALDDLRAGRVRGAAVLEP